MSNPVIHYKNIFTAAQITADQEAAGYPDDRLVDLRPYMRWKGTSSANQNITFNIGFSKSADAIGICGHNLGTAGATVLVQYWTGAAWSSASGPVLATNDKPILMLFTTQAGTQWRVALTGMTATPEIGVIMLGDLLTMEKPIHGTWDPDSQTTQAEGHLSKTGELLQATVRFHEYNLSAEFARLSKAWADTNLIPFWENHGRQLKPFFFSRDPTSFPEDLRFVRVTDAPQLTLPYDPIRRTWQLSMRGVLN